MTPARIQLILPFLVATLASAIIVVILFVSGNGGLFQVTPSATLTFGVVIAGFAGTQRNMFINMQDSTVLRFAVRTGYYKDVLKYLARCIWAGLFVSVVSLLGFIATDYKTVQMVWLVSLGFSVTLAMATLIQNEILMGRISARYMEDRVSDSDWPR